MNGAIPRKTRMAGGEGGAFAIAGRRSGSPGASALDSEAAGFKRRFIIMRWTGGACAGTIPPSTARAGRRPMIQGPSSKLAGKLHAGVFLAATIAVCRPIERIWRVARDENRPADRQEPRGCSDGNFPADTPWRGELGITVLPPPGRPTRGPQYRVSRNWRRTALHPLR